MLPPAQEQCESSDLKSKSDVQQGFHTMHLGNLKTIVVTAVLARVLFPTIGYGQNAKTTLSVSAEGFKNTKGQAIIAVYSSKETWLQLEKAIRLQKVKPVKTEINVKFEDLVPGTYAVGVIHDENENGKLDMRYFPFPRPREGAGVSNDARKNMGPPSWDDSKFTLSSAGTAINIKIRY
jgi:uncharacterized protein (DUF2141 family)